MHENESESEVAQSCPTLSDPMDCSLPGSSVPGIFQARVLEWGAIAFSKSIDSWYHYFWNDLFIVKMLFFLRFVFFFFGHGGSSLQHTGFL